MSGPSRIRVSAPGKLLLVGEYSVVFGGVGFAASVDRCVVASPAPSEPVDTRNLVDSCRAYAAMTLGDPPPALAWRADSSRLCKGGVKLGLGSSAAVAAAAVTSLLVEREGELDVDAERNRIWSIALGAHRAFQGGAGSGIDVAASVFGGVVGFRGGTTPQVTPRRLPRDLHLVPLWTGRAASTRDLLAAVFDGAANVSQTFEGLLDEMVEVVESLLAGDAEPTATDWIAAAQRYGALMDRLGALVDAPIVTPMMRRLIVLAEELGGAAKPSGAGGGDVVLGFLGSEAAAAGFREAGRALGAMPIDLVIGVSGVRSWTDAAGGDA